MTFYIFACAFLALIAWSGIAWSKVKLICNFLSNYHLCQIKCLLICIPNRNTWECLIPPTALTAEHVIRYFSCCQSARWEMVSDWILTFISLIVNESEHIFKWLCALWVFYEFYVHILIPFLEMFSFFLNFYKCLSNRNIEPFDTSCRYFSNFTNLFLLYLVLFFVTMQKNIFVVMHLSIISLMIFIFCIIVRKVIHSPR